jgi:hypothetical protein
MHGPPSLTIACATWTGTVGLTWLSPTDEVAATSVLALVRPRWGAACDLGAALGGFGATITTFRFQGFRGFYDGPRDGTPLLRRRVDA